MHYLCLEKTNIEGNLYIFTYEFSTLKIYFILKNRKYFT